MIVSDKHKFVFIHIPKCGGTTLRVGIKKFDDTDGFFTNIKDNPDYGKLNYVHLPLFMIKKLYPDTFSKILDYDSIAFIRNPYKRFSSSLAQHIREYRNCEITHLSNKRILEIAHEVVDTLKAYKYNLLPYEYIHFQPQEDYIYVDGDKYVKYVFAINNIKSAIKLIEKKTKCIIDNETTKNKTVIYKNSSVRIAIRILKKIGLRPFLFSFYKKYFHLFTGSKNKIDDFILDDKKINDFIMSFYQNDIILYKLNSTNKNKNE
jgi:hypothetical protein